LISLPLTPGDEFGVVEPGVVAELSRATVVVTCVTPLSSPEFPHAAATNTTAMTPPSSDRLARADQMAPIFAPFAPADLTLLPVL
jgi:hypothetical protein